MNHITRKITLLKLSLPSFRVFGEKNRKSKRECMLLGDAIRLKSSLLFLRLLNACYSSSIHANMLKLKPQVAQAQR
jgi:hypothetical protein